MYLDHYNLTLKPFEISPDPKFLWLGEKHNEAFAAMIYGIMDNKGFISLTGDVGSGKTTLVNALINRLEDNIIFAKFFDPPLEKLDFFNSLADAFGMNKTFSTKGDFLNHLRSFLNNASDHNQEVVLIIEEAQRFNQEQLEEVRLISNIERPDKKLINIIFVGQNEFESILEKNKPLRQRVAIAHKIEPLQEIETKQYIMHRLKTAGSEKEIFSPEAYRDIHSFSEGNPRLINIICDLALLSGYAEDRKIIDPELIKECANSRLLPTQQKEAAIEYLKASSKPTVDIETGYQPSTSSGSNQKLARKKPPKPTGFKFAFAAPISVAFLLSIFGYLYLYGDNHALYRDVKTFLGQTFDRYTSSKLETSSQNSDKTSAQQRNVAGTSIQTFDFMAQKASFENQIGQLKSRNQALIADLAELRGVKERIAELEGEAASRRQTLSQVKQKIAALTDALDQEKKSRERISSELSSKVALIAELQGKLEAPQTNAVELEAQIENRNIQINELQNRLSNLEAEKASVETRLDQLKFQNDALTADLAELSAAKERIAELEGITAKQERTLSQAAQKATELTKALEREKTGRETLNSEISIKDDRIAELQEKLDAALSGRSALEKDVATSKKEITELQGRPKELKARNAPPEPSPASVDAQKESPSTSESFPEQGEAPSPTDIIDWVFEKKEK